MSAPSGIKVPPAVSQAFHDAVKEGEGARAVVFLIEGEQFTHHKTLAPSSTSKDDISLLLPSLPTPKTCASFAYRSDDKSAGAFEWYMITYVPDDAGVRQKMIQASSKAGLVKALGGVDRFKWDMFFTSQSDLTPKSFASHLLHLSSPPPLTASEKALAEIKSYESSLAQSSLAAALSGKGRGGTNAAGVHLEGNDAMRGMIGKKVEFKWGEGVEEALKGLGEGVGESGKVVMLHFDPPPLTLRLQLSATLKPEELANKIPSKEPCYTFFAWPTPKPSPPPIVVPSAVELEKEGTADKPDEDTKPEDIALPVSPAAEVPPPSISSLALHDKPAEKPKIAFIYTCPAASPVKNRMLYSSSLRSVMQTVGDKFGVVAEKKLETSDPEDLTSTYLKSELFPPVSASKYGSGTTSFTPSAGGTRNFPIPSRSSTVSSTGSGTSTGTDSTPVGKVSEGAFEMFGPRVGSPGGGAGFARPKPAGRR